MRNSQTADAFDISYQTQSLYRTSIVTFPVSRSSYTNTCPISLQGDRLAWSTTCLQKRGHRPRRTRFCGVSSLALLKRHSPLVMHLRQQSQVRHAVLLSTLQVSLYIRWILALEYMRMYASSSSWVVCLDSAVAME